MRGEKKAARADDEDDRHPSISPARGASWGKERIIIRVIVIKISVIVTKSMKKKRRGLFPAAPH